MAAGITQTGAGANILFEDNTHGDAGGDGSYSYADIAAKYPADFVDVAVQIGVTLPKRLYVSKVSLQNGDGTGTAVTTLKEQDSILVFVTGKTYIVSNVGLANRTTELGIEVPGSIGKPTGRNGSIMVCGAAPTLRGNFKGAGSILWTIGNLIFQPGATGLVGRLINMLLESTGNMGWGTSTGELSFMYNVDGVSLGAAAAGGLVQFNCLDAQRITMSAPNASEIIRTGGAVKTRDLVLIGGGSNAADLRNSGTSIWQLMDTTYSQTAPQADLAGPGIEDWATGGAKVVLASTGAAITGKRVQFLDRAGAAVVDAISDAEGLLEHGSGITEDGVKVRVRPSDLSIDDRGPFTIICNDPSFADYDETLETYSRKASWIGRNYTGGRQLQPMIDVIALAPAQPQLNPIDTVDVPYFQEQDILPLLEDSGQPVSISSDVTKGYVHRVTRKVLLGEGASVLATDVYVFVKTGTLPQLAIGALLSVDGETLTVRETGTIGDGALTQIYCAATT